VQASRTTFFHRYQISCFENAQRITRETPRAQNGIGFVFALSGEVSGPTVILCGISEQFPERESSVEDVELSGFFRAVG